MRAVSHLTPCMQAMAVCTEQAEVSGVRLPVSEPVIPNACAAIVSEFHRSINVVNIKNSMVGLTARHTHSPEGFDQFHLALPVSGMFVFCKSVFVPVILTAFIFAKSILALFSAVFAGLLFTPSGGEVTGLIAILSCAILYSVCMCFKAITAMFTDGINLSAFAHDDLLNTCCHFSTKYFDIACRRIEDAQRQSRMFV